MPYKPLRQAAAARGARCWGLAQNAKISGAVETNELKETKCERGGG